MMNATLINKKSETPDITSYQFQPDQPVQWQAGQFIEYHLPQPSPDDRGESRYFTISSAPHEGYIQITTRLDRQHGSTFKATLDTLKVGDHIEISEPMGEFVVENPQEHFIFIAGGIGITPFRSILADLAHKQQPINTTLLYANRSQEMAFKSELEKLASEHPSLTIQYFVGNQLIQLADITQAANQLNEGKVYLYISGPEPMVGNYQQQLEQAGYTSDRIITDYFPGYDD